MKRIFITRPWKLLILVSAINIASAYHSVLFAHTTRFFIQQIQSGLSIFTGQGFLLVGLLLFLSVNIDYFGEIWKASYLKKTILELKREIAYHLFQEDLETLLRMEEKGGLLSKVTSDIKIIEDAYVNTIIDILYGLCLLVFVIVTMFQFHWILGTVIGVFMLLYLIKPARLQDKYGKAKEVESEENQRFLHKVNNIFSGVSIIKTFQIEGKSFDNFEKVNCDLEESRFQTQKRYAFLSLYVGTLGIAMQISIILVCAILTQYKLFTFAEWAATLQMMILIVSPMNTIKRGVIQIQSVKPIVDKIDKYLKEIPAYVHERTLCTLYGDICVKDVSYQYESQEQKKALEDVRLIFEQGKKYAIIGRSGSGKSTLLKLLAKQLQLQDGSIKIGENNYRDIRADDFYQNVSVIGQEVFLFDDSVKNNITLYNDYNSELIEKVIKQVKLKEVMQRSKGELDAMSYHFSGGERQRISIARALIRQNRVIFCDEIFSALDKKTTLNINGILLSLDGVTVINITHDISRQVLEQYDEIIMLENGRVAYRGKYNADIIIEKML